tara:strand:- start:23922 stop:24362 length:441 start_codon:yes stop_codon:yes gene_type:complete
MGVTVLEEIKITPLKKIMLETGDVYKGLEKNDKNFTKFGELYFSFINFNKIKAWKKHNSMKMNLIVPIGKVKFVFFCENNKNFREEIIGTDNYSRLTIPPNVWFGFMGLEKPKSLIVNLASICHDDNEVNRLEINNNLIKYSWENL